MAGTKEGGKRAAATNKARYGANFYTSVGREGGRAWARRAKLEGLPMGFAGDPEQARIAGSKGGKAGAGKEHDWDNHPSKTV